MMRRLVKPVLVCMFFFVVPAQIAFAGSSRPDEVAFAPDQAVRAVDIGGVRYYAGNAFNLAGSVAQAPQVRAILIAVMRCHEAGAWGFASSQARGGGIVAWFPTNPLRCFDNETTGGGPGGGPGIQPCFQLVRTPDRRYVVAIAATKPRVCADLSTQVPGGVSGRLTVAVGQFPRGSQVAVKCQYTDARGRLVDYVAPFARALPASKPTAWVYDQSLDTGLTYRISGVPACYGAYSNL
jgi:hypothetical protein